MSDDELNDLDEIETNIRLADEHFNYSMRWRQCSTVDKVNWLVDCILLKDDINKQLSQKLKDANETIQHLKDRMRDMMYND